MSADTKDKAYFGLSAIVVLGAAIGGWYLFGDSLTSSSGNALKSPDAILGAESETDSSEEQISVSLVLNYGNAEEVSYEQSIKPGTSAIDLLNEVSAANNIAVEYQEFEFGRFVQKIGDTAGDSSHYWGFYVNGSMADVGADAYILNDGDSIAFKYSEM